MTYENYIQKGTIIGLEMHTNLHPTVVVCDYPGCKNQFPDGLGVKSDVTLARMAREAGWIGPMERGKEGDMCPEHSNLNRT